MEGKLYLTSSSFFKWEKGNEDLINYFKNKKVLLVDNATITGSNLEGKAKLIEDFNKIGCFLTILTLNNENLSQLLNYDCVYITGGDVGPLVELANSTNMASIVINYLENGGLIVGESAGSMIFGKGVRWCYDIKRGIKEKWNKQLESYRGLGIVDINFFPHWNKTDQDLKEKTRKYEKDRAIKITRVEDGEYILVYYTDILKLNNVK